jgi:DNA-binding CsgD family transcriptional regulator
MSSVHTGHIPYELDSEAAVAAPDGWISHPEGFEVPAKRSADRASTTRLEGPEDAVVIVDDDLRVLFANRPAEALLAAGGRLRIDAFGTLRCDEGIDLRPLVDAARDPVGRARPTLTVERRVNTASLRILAAPLHARVTDAAVSGRRAVMLVISDPEFEAATRKERLRMLFGLTPAEAAFAMEIVKGDGRRAAAERRGIACSTARTHLSSIFEKTGTRRQAELVRLLLQIDAGAAASSS